MGAVPVAPGLSSVVAVAPTSMGAHINLLVVDGEPALVAGPALAWLP